MLLLPIKQQLFNRTGGGVVHMGHLTLVPIIELPLPEAISTFSMWSTGIDIANLATSDNAARTWNQANRAMLYGITIPADYTVRFFRWVSGTSVFGNYDIGLYDKNFQLLRSAGSTPHPGSTVFVQDAVTPLTLQPGTYWIAFVADNALFGHFGRTSGPIATMNTSPIRGALASFPLPLTIVPKDGPASNMQALSIANALV